MNRVGSRNEESVTSNLSVGLSLEGNDHPILAPELSAITTTTHIANCINKNFNSDRISLSSPQNDRMQQATTPKGEWEAVEVSHDSSPPPSQHSLHTASLWKHCFIVFRWYSGDRIYFADPKVEVYNFVNSSKYYDLIWWS